MGMRRRGVAAPAAIIARIKEGLGSEAPSEASIGGIHRWQAAQAASLATAAPSTPMECGYMCTGVRVGYSVFVTRRASRRAASSLGE